VNTLVFDGDCGFCTTSVLWLFRQVRPENVEAVQYQSFDLVAHGLSAERAQYEVLWVSQQGPPFGGARAIARLLRASERFGWRLAGRLMALAPFSWAASVTYRVIAQNRQRMPGSTGSCAVRVTRPD
jgi:predicted DCC family thiol-disulfide oxidoreductase YuxK